MRSGIKFLALCGVVGLALSVGMAQDRDQFLQTKRYEKSSRKSMQFFPMSGEKAAKNSLTPMKKLQPVDLPQKMVPASTRQQPPARSATGVMNANFSKTKGMNDKGNVQPVSMQRNSGVTNALAETPGPFARVPASLMPPVPPKEQKPVIRVSAKGYRRNQNGQNQYGQESGRLATSRPSTGSQTSMVTLKWEKNGTINIGQLSRCKLVVSNSGQTEAQDVFVKVQFPEFVTITNTTPAAEVQDVTYAWQFRTLAAGETQTVDIEFTPTTGANFTADAKVRYTGSASEVFKIRHPELVIAMKGPKEVMIGDISAHYVTITNPGSGVANNVALEAKIPEGLEHPRGTRLLMKIGSLNPGESRSIRLALTAVKGGDHSLQVRATADSIETKTSSSLVSVTAPSLNITMDGPRLRYLGRDAGYQIRVENDGTASTNNVKVYQRLPEGFEFLSADKNGQFDPNQNTISWFVGHLDAGETVTVKAKVKAVQLGNHTHQVGAISEHGAQTDAKMQTRVEGTASLVLEIVDLDDPIEVGRETAYEVRVKNAGTKSAINVAITCELPNGVELITSKGPTESIAENGLVIFKSLPELAPGKTAVYRVNVKGKVPGNLRFKARLASDTIRKPLTFEELTKYYID